MMVEWRSRTSKPLFLHLLLLPLLLLHSHNVIVVHAFACHPIIISNKRTTRTRTSFGIHPTNSFTITTTTLHWRSPALLQQATSLFNDRVIFEQSNLKNTQLHHALPRHRHFLQHEPMQPEIEHDASSSRRSFLSQFLCYTPIIVSSWCLHPNLADAAEATTIMVDLSSDKLQDEVTKDETKAEVRPSAFHSAAFGLEEYNNSIIASRDTNISPKEVYDTISSDYLRAACDAAAIENARNDKESFNKSSNTRSRNRKQRMTPKALDVGAGAGVSTEILYRMGYQTIDALDWSGKAWERYVVSDPDGVCPESVQFYELDDERYLESWRKKYGNGDDGLFDAIVFNFAINESKATTFATELLNKEHGVLLAPINISTDYWLKQRYKVMDASGKVLWSTEDVGAWSVLFQPDVTQDTCQGIWCSPYNGFQKKR